MSEVLHINQKNYISVGAAARSVSYSRDHITRLAREKKIRSILLDRQWYIDPTSLQSYIQSAELESSIRKRQLSETRKEERARHQRLLDVTKHFAVERNKLSRTSVATWWSGMAVTVGVMVGVFVSQADLFSEYVTPLLNSAGSGTYQATVIASNQEVTTTFSYESAPDVIPVIFTPTVEQTTLPTNSVGVLLIPGTARSAGEVVVIADMFSDPVVVKRDEAGVRVVTPATKGDSVPAPEIPFITVPITHVRE